MSAVPVKLPDLLDGIARDVRRIVDTVPLENQLDELRKLAGHVEEIAKAIRSPR